MELLKIGTQVYCVHKSFIGGKHKNSKVIIGKVRSYEFIDGTLYPVIKEAGEKRMVRLDTHTMYNTLENAVKAITPVKEGPIY